MQKPGAPFARRSEIGLIYTRSDPPVAARRAPAGMVKVKARRGRFVRVAAPALAARKAPQRPRTRQPRKPVRKVAAPARPSRPAPSASAGSTGVPQVYVLELEGGYVYVGKAVDVQARLRDHRGGGGSAFTKAHRPTGRLLPRLGTLNGSGDGPERDETLRQMLRHGAKRVRGWR